MKPIEIYTVYDEKKYVRIPKTNIPTGIIRYIFDSIFIYEGTTKIVHGAMEGTVFFPLLTYSLQ